MRVVASLLAATLLAQPTAAASARLQPSGRMSSSHPRAPARHVVLDAPAAGFDACTQPVMRPAPAARTFSSSAVDALIASLLPKFIDPNLGTIFSNALPNALDTTVFQHTTTPSADTFIITGDIIAMWLRDSTNQVWPYVPLLSQDAPLRALVTGLIGRQARSVLIDAYANAFQVDASAGQGPHADDSTYTTLFAGTVVSAMTPLVFERKWEVDSLANVLRLSAAYFNATGGDVTPFNATWVAAVGTILATYADQQQDTAMEDAAGGPVYQFQRNTGEPSDTLEHGRGFPVKYTGMIKGAFRGSDDAMIYNYNIPENAFASVALREVVPVLNAVGETALAAMAANMSATIVAAIQAHGTFNHPTAGLIYAYEVDGFGNVVFMDDANIPGLLSMPYYGFTSVNDSLYQATRAAVLSDANPWYLSGSAGAGVGGPHNGWPYVWPMAIIMQGWTAQTDAEVAGVINTLVGASACTGLVHESFNKDNFGDFTRPWFAWVNSLFGDFVLKVANERPQIIFK